MAVDILKFISVSGLSKYAFEGRMSARRFADTESTPWFIIRSDDKYLARLEAMRVILNVVKYQGRKRDLDFILNPDIVI